MGRVDPQEMARWLARRTREGWSWAQLAQWSGHPVWKLRYWQRRPERGGRASKGRAAAFVAVEVTTPAANSNASIEITTPSGYRVQIPGDFDAEHLRRVLEAVERRC